MLAVSCFVSRNNLNAKVSLLLKTGTTSLRQQEE